MSSCPEPEPARSSAVYILEAAGFKLGRFGYTSDDFPGIEISEDEARRMNSRDLLLRIYRDATSRACKLLQSQIRININTLLGTSL